MINNITLIDDNKIDLFVNQKIIEKYDSGLKTRMFTSAVSAINYLKILDLNINSDSLTKPDLIFLDINMPQMDGFQFFNELRKFDLQDIKPIHIYMLSSSLSLEDINKAKSESLCSGYITKPLTVEKLKTILETVGIEDKNYNYKKPI
mgnify:CR=1 FL=1|jgi:CheY-like chemotaxis protein